MPRFGGNEFTTFSVPLAFEGRYFILEPGQPPRVSVILDNEGQILVEVLRNQPVDNPITNVTRHGASIVTVSDRKTGRFLYKIRPKSLTTVTFTSTLGTGETRVRISDRSIRVGTNEISNSTFSGVMAGALVRPDGSWAIGAPIPPLVLRALLGQS